MLGAIADYLYVLFQNGTGDIPKGAGRISIINNNSNNHWICFLPESILSFKFIKRKIISSRDTEVYVIPKTSIQPNPNLTRGVLERITEEAIDDYSKRQNENINVLGISLGNAPAYKFANNFPANRFVSVVPGSFLPECIFESIATKRIAENSGYNSEDYREALDDFSPIRNLNGLRARSLEVYLGRFDRMVPYPRGNELVEGMRKRGLNPKLTIFPFSGHCEAIFYSLRVLDKRIEF